MEYDKLKRKAKEPSRKIKRKMTILLPIGALFLALALALVYVDVVQIIANFKVEIRNGSEIFEFLEGEAEAVMLFTYLFNVTNADAFLRGEDHKLQVQEVGPFTYMEVRSNEDIEVDEEAQTLSYSPKMRAVFLPEKSVADPRNVTVFMPNVAMLAMSSMAVTHGYFAQLGFKLLLQSLSSKPIVHLTAHEFLWGYNEPLIRLGNTVFPGWISFETLGVMDRMYNRTTEYRLEVSTSLHDKFKVKKMNGMEGMKDWDYEDPTKRTECNIFNNVYEGIMFPNQLRPGAPLKLFRNILCRFLKLDYQGRVTTKNGIDALLYKVDKENYQINNDTECLCGRGTCINGISDLSPCYYGLSLALSNAHFLNGDPKLLERIEGLNPSEEKHGSEILIEPKIGMIMKTSFTAQVNVVVKDIDFNAKAKAFSNMVVPLGYFQLEQPELTDSNIATLNGMCVIGPTVFFSIEILFFLAGTLILAYCVFLLLPKLAYFKGKGIVIRGPADDKRPGNSVPLLKH